MKSRKPFRRYVQGEKFTQVPGSKKLLAPNPVLFYKVSWIDVIPNWWGGTMVARTWSDNFEREADAKALYRSIERSGLSPRLETFYPTTDPKTFYVFHSF